MSHNPWHIDDEVPYGHSPDHYNDPYGLLRAEAQGPMAPGSRGVNYNEIGGVLPGLLGGLVQGSYESIKGLLGRGRDFARENPVEAAKIGAEFAVDMSPVGNPKALFIDTPRFAGEGRYGMSAISALSAMPWWLGLPVGADMIRARANAADAMASATKTVDEVPSTTRVLDEVDEATETVGNISSPTRTFKMHQGAYVGAPRYGATKVDSPEAVERMNRRYIEHVINGMEGRDFYTNSADWLDTATSSAWRPRVANVIGETSPRATPQANLDFTLKNLTRNARDEFASGGSTGRKLQVQEAMEGSSRDLMGPKVGAFAELVEKGAGDVSVNDFWQARAFGYKNTDGTPWEGGLDARKHAFIQENMDDIVDWLNANKVGGHTDWDHGSAQAAAWTGVKREFGDIPEGVTRATDFADEAKTFETYLTHEQIPGSGIGHLDRVGDMSRTQKQAFSAEAPWAVPRVNTRTGEIVMVDPLYEASGLLQNPMNRNLVGASTDASGVSQVNPLEVSTPLMPRQPWDQASEGLLTQPAQDILKQIEGSRGFVDAQNMSAWHRVIPDAPVEHFNSVRVMAPSGEKLTSSQLIELGNLAERELPGVVAVHTDDGSMTLLHAWEAGGDVKGKDLQELVDGVLGDEIEKIVPNSSSQAVRTHADNVDLEALWKGEQGQGHVSRKFMELNSNETLKRRIETPLREKAKANYERNIRWADQGGGELRDDLQNALKIFSEGGFDAFQKAIDNGTVLPSVAILGGLGLTRYMDIQEPGT